jgi:hypothetical protein
MASRHRGVPRKIGQGTSALSLRLLNHLQDGTQISAALRELWGYSVHTGVKLQLDVLLPSMRPPTTGVR